MNFHHFESSEKCVFVYVPHGVATNRVRLKSLLNNGSDGEKK